jgi:hypothetical protein
MKVSQIQEISEEVKESGVVLVNDFLNSEQFELVNNVLKNVHDNQYKKGDRQGYFPVGLKNIIVKLSKFEFNKLKKSFLLKKIAKDLQFKKIAEKIFDHEAELYMLDSYYSKKSNEFIIPWHNDIAYNSIQIDPRSKDLFYAQADLTVNLKKTKVGGRGIKFFIYMTDVESENGCMSSIPYSHHIVKAITSLILKKKIKLEAYWHLKDLRALVLKNPIKNLLRDKVGNEKLNIFLNSSEFTEQNASDTSVFDYKMKKGGAVIFDEMVVHRGSEPSKHARLVLRYHYHKKI